MEPNVARITQWIALLSSACLLWQKFEAIGADRPLFSARSLVQRGAVRPPSALPQIEGHDAANRMENPVI